MNHLTRFSASAGLFCCLAASPALADVATPEPGSPSLAPSAVSEAVAALQSVNTIVGELADSTPASAQFAAATKSTGTMSGYYTPLGADVTISAVASGAADASSSSASSGPGISLAAVAASFTAAPPATSQTGGSVIGSGTVVSSADALIQPISSDPTSGNTVVVTDASPVPLPPALLLLASGLVGLMPQRRGFLRLA